MNEMDLELKKTELKNIGRGWYELTLEFNIKTMTLYVKPRIQLRADNPLDLANLVGDTLWTVRDAYDYKIVDQEEEE